MTFIDLVSSSQNFILDAELPADLAAREALLDRAMGPERKRRMFDLLNQTVAETLAGDDARPATRAEFITALRATVATPSPVSCTTP